MNRLALLAGAVLGVAVAVIARFLRDQAPDQGTPSDDEIRDFLRDARLCCDVQPNPPDGYQPYLCTLKAEHPERHHKAVIDRMLIASWPRSEHVAPAPLPTPERVEEAVANLRNRAGGRERDEVFPPVCPVHPSHDVRWLNTGTIGTGDGFWWCRDCQQMRGMPPDPAVANDALDPASVTDGGDAQ